MSTAYQHVLYLEKGFAASRGVFGNVGKPETMLCVGFGVESGCCFTGGGNGQVYCWSDRNLVRVLDAHDGPCFALIRTGQVSMFPVPARDDIP